MTQVTTLQLLNPINVILCEVAPLGIKKISCNHEISLQKDSHFDVAWSFVPEGSQARIIFTISKMKIICPQ